MGDSEGETGMEAETTKDMEEEADTIIIQETKGGTLLPNG